MEKGGGQGKDGGGELKEGRGEGLTLDRITLMELVPRRARLLHAACGCESVTSTASFSP